MANRSERAKLGKETVKILEEGCYRTSEGDLIKLEGVLEKCKEETKLYGPEDLKKLVEGRIDEKQVDTEIEVTGECTLKAARRLLTQQQEQESSAAAAAGGLGKNPICCLNFASAKNPGGGFLGGSRAQEESLAMASGLYTSLTASQVQDYYAKNKPTRGGIYTDHLIYSPGVPVIRHEETNELLATPYCVNLITMPAVNANVARKQTCEEEIEKIMKHRADCVLSVAAEEGEKFLVLGAWGCGVFGNHPTFVAETFRHLLVGKEANFGNVFTRIVFAVLDHTKDEAKLNAFKRTFQKI